MEPQSVESTCSLSSSAGDFSSNTQSGDCGRAGGDTSIALPDPVVFSRSAETLCAPLDTHAHQSRQNRTRALRHGGVPAGRRGAAGVESSTGGSRGCGRKGSGVANMGSSNILSAMQFGNIRKSNSCTAQCERLRSDYTFEKPGLSAYTFPSMYEELLKIFDQQEVEPEARVSTHTDPELALLMSESLSDYEDRDSPLSENLLFRIFTGPGRNSQPTSPSKRADRDKCPTGAVASCTPAPTPGCSSSKERQVGPTNSFNTAGAMETSSHSARPQPPSPPDDTLNISASELSILPSASATLLSSNTTYGKVLPKPPIPFSNQKMKIPEIAKGTVAISVSSSMETNNPCCLEQSHQTEESTDNAIALSLKSCSDAPEKKIDSSYGTLTGNITKGRTGNGHIKSKENEIRAEPSDDYSFFEKVSRRAKIPLQTGIDYQNNIVNARPKALLVTSQNKSASLVSKSSMVRSKSDKRVPLPAEIVQAINRAIELGRLSGSRENGLNDAETLKPCPGLRSESGPGRQAFPSRSSKFPSNSHTIAKANVRLQPLSFFKVSARSKQCKVKSLTEECVSKVRPATSVQQKPELVDVENLLLNAKGRKEHRGPLYNKSQTLSLKEPPLFKKMVMEQNEASSDTLSTPPNSPTRSKPGITFSDPIATCVTDRNTNMALMGNAGSGSQVPQRGVSISGNQSHNKPEHGGLEHMRRSLGDENEDTLHGRLTARAEGDKIDQSSELQKENKTEGFEAVPVTSISNDSVFHKAPLKATLNSHPSILLKPQEYLDFYSFLRSKKPVRKEVRQPKTKIFKLSRMMTDISGGTGVSTHQMLDTGESTPIFPRGREVPPGWMPGQHGSHPITRISAEYEMAANKPSKSKKHSWKKIKSPKRNIRVRESRPPLSASASANLLISQPKEKKRNRGREISLDSSDDISILTTSEFERKRRFYERQQRFKNRHEGGGKSNKKTKAKKVTEQVNFLKTIDDICNAEEGEGNEDGLQPASSNLDIRKQMLYENDEYLTSSLARYYSKKLANVAPWQDTERQGGSLTHLPGLRITRNIHQVPSAISLDRLRAIRPPSPEWTYGHRAGLLRRGHYSNPNLPLSSAKWPEATSDTSVLRVPKKYGKKARAVPDWASPSQLGIHSDYKEAWEQLRASYVEINRMASQMSPKRPGDLKTNASEEKKSASKSDKSPSKKKASATKLLAGLKEKSSNYKVKQMAKLPPPPNRSEEDTWCYSVNAMLLKAKKAMADNQDHKKGTHRFPRHNSAAVVSPVIETKATPNFLKTLLKQDAEELRRNKASASAAALSANEASLKQQRDRIRNAVNKAPTKRSPSTGRAMNINESSSPKNDSVLSKDSSWSEELATESAGRQRSNTLPAKGTAREETGAFVACRIPRPLDLSNPRNRNPLKKIQPLPQGSEKPKKDGAGPSYVLDQTLHYYAYPYITDKSITPLFGNVNTNALPRYEDFPTDFKIAGEPFYRVDRFSSKPSNNRSARKSVFVAGTLIGKRIVPTNENTWSNDKPTKNELEGVNVSLVLSKQNSQPQRQKSDLNSKDHRIVKLYEKRVFGKSRFAQNPTNNVVSLPSLGAPGGVAPPTVKKEPSRANIKALDQRNSVQSLLNTDKGSLNAHQLSKLTESSADVDLATAKANAEAAYSSFCAENGDGHSAETMQTLDSCSQDVSSELNLCEVVENDSRTLSPHSGRGDTYRQLKADSRSTTRGPCLTDIIDMCTQANTAAATPRRGPVPAPRRRILNKKLTRYRRYPLGKPRVVYPELPLVILGVTKNTISREKVCGGGKASFSNEPKRSNGSYQNRSTGKVPRVSGKEGPQPIIRRAAAPGLRKEKSNVAHQSVIFEYSNELGPTENVEPKVTQHEILNRDCSQSSNCLSIYNSAELERKDSLGEISYTFGGNYKVMTEDLTRCSEIDIVGSCELIDGKKLGKSRGFKASAAKNDEKNVQNVQDVSKRFGTNKSRHDAHKKSRRCVKENKEAGPSNDSNETCQLNNTGSGDLVTHQNSENELNSVATAVEQVHRANADDQNCPDTQNSKAFRSQFYCNLSDPDYLHISQYDLDKDYGAFHSEHESQRDSGENQPACNTQRDSGDIRSGCNEPWHKSRRCDADDRISTYSSTPSLEPASFHDHSELGSLGGCSFFKYCCSAEDGSLLSERSFLQDKVRSNPDLNENQVSEIASDYECVQSASELSCIVKDEGNSENCQSTASKEDICEVCTTFSNARDSQGNASVKIEDRDDGKARPVTPYGDLRNKPESPWGHAEQVRLSGMTSLLLCHQEEPDPDCFNIDPLDSPETNSCSRETDNCGPPPPTPFGLQAEYFYDPDSLQCLRLGDVVQEFISRRDKLLAGLEAVVTARYYIPAFRMEEWNVSHTSPTIIKVNYCSSDTAALPGQGDTYGRRLRPGTPLTVFYTQDYTGSPICLYTARGVERGLYSLLNRDVVPDQDHLGSPKLGALVEHPTGTGSSPPERQHYPLLLLSAPVSTRGEAVREVNRAHTAAWERCQVSVLMERCMDAIPSWTLPTRHGACSRRLDALYHHPSTKNCRIDDELAARDGQLRAMLTDFKDEHVDILIRSFKTIPYENLSDKNIFSDILRGKAIETTIASRPTVKSQALIVNRNVKTTLGWSISNNGVALPVFNFARDRSKFHGRLQNTFPNVTSVKCVVDTWRQPAVETPEDELNSDRSKSSFNQRLWWWRKSSTSLNSNMTTRLGTIGSKTLASNHPCNLPPVKSLTKREALSTPTAENNTQRYLSHGGNSQGTESSTKDTSKPSCAASEREGANQFGGWEWPKPVLPPPFPNTLKRPKGGFRKVVPIFRPRPARGRGRRPVRKQLQRRTRKKRTPSSSLKSYSSGPSTSSSSCEGDDKKESVKTTTALLRDLQGQRQKKLSDILAKGAGAATPQVRLPYTVRKTLEAKKQREEKETAEELQILGRCGGSGDSKHPPAFSPRPTAAGSPLTTPSLCSGDAADTVESPLLDEYDLLSDADEAKELWQKCFPPVRYSSKKERWCRVKDKKRSHLYAKAAVQLGLGSPV